MEFRVMEFPESRAPWSQLLVKSCGVLVLWGPLSWHGSRAMGPEVLQFKGEEVFRVFVKYAK